ncbi:hypothetical protein V6N13_059332 [Hibiscus sabdariffa]
MAKFRPRLSYWRKVVPSKKSGIQPSTFSQPLQRMPRQEEQSRLNTNGSSSKSGSDYVKVKGFIEEEAIWKLQKCLIGFTAVDSDSAGKDRFQIRVAEIPAPIAVIRKNINTGPVINKVFSSPSTSSSSGDNSDQGTSMGARGSGKRMEFNADCIGNERAVCDNLIDEEINRQLGEEEMKGVTSRHKTWAEVVINNGMSREYGDNHSVQARIHLSGSSRNADPAGAKRHRFV